MKKILFLLSMFIHATIHAQIGSVTKPTIRVADNKDNAEFEKFKKRFDKEEVWFYENTHYTGKKYKLGRGEYSLKELGANANDFFSSALIPSNLVVMVFESDNREGNYYILKPDEAGKLYNVDFTKVEVAEGKDPSNRRLIGTKDLNDNISSIVVFDANKDMVTLYDDCDYKGYNISLRPGPNPNWTDASFYTYSQKGGWCWNNLADYKIDDKASAIKLFGKIKLCKISNEVEFKGAAYIGSINGNISCLKSLFLTTNGSFIADNSNWNDRISAIKIWMQPGTVTIEN